MEHAFHNSLRNVHAETGGVISPQTRIHGHLFKSFGEFTFQSIPLRNPWCDLKKNLFSIDSSARQETSEHNTQGQEYSRIRSHVGSSEVRNQSARFSQTKVFNPIVLQTSSGEVTARERPEMNDRIERNYSTEVDTAKQDVTKDVMATSTKSESHGLDCTTAITSNINVKGNYSDQREIGPMNTPALFENGNQRFGGKSDDQEDLCSLSPGPSFNEPYAELHDHGRSNSGGGKQQDKHNVEKAHQNPSRRQENVDILCSFVNSEDGTGKNLSDNERIVHSSETGKVYSYSNDDTYFNFPSYESSNKNTCNENSSKDDNNNTVYNCNADSCVINNINSINSRKLSCNKDYIGINKILEQPKLCDSGGSIAIEQKGNTKHSTHDEQRFNIMNEKSKTAGKNCEHDKQDGHSVSRDLTLDSFSPTESCTETHSLPKSAFRRVNASVFYPASARLALSSCISQSGQTDSFRVDRGYSSDIPGFSLSDMCNLYQLNTLANIPVSAVNNRMEFFQTQFRPAPRPLLSQNDGSWTWPYNTFYPYSVKKLWQNNHYTLYSGAEGNEYSIPPEDQMTRHVGEEIPMYNALSKSEIMMYRCGLCGFTCSSGSQLKSHGRIHSGRDGKLFKCECGRAFARNEELTRHRRIHSDYKPHQCHVCKKAFGRKDHLGKHLVTHLDTSQKKVHRCTVCGCEQRYTRSDALARHQWAAHGIKARPAKSGAQK